jgi:hypothetical protein
MKKPLFALSVALMLASCVPSTPQTRIAHNPQLFSALSEKQKPLVECGQIDRGMTRDAVFLAWGPASRIFQGSKNGKATERWDYAGSQPVYHNHFYGGYGYGPYGHIHPVYGFGMGPDVAYIPYRIASVWFVDGRVNAWERLR